MKIILKEIMSEIDLDRQTMSPQEFKKAYPQLFTLVKSDEKHNIYKQFLNYVNHSRSKFEILPDGEFTGSEDVLNSFKKSFEKSHNVEVITTTKLAGGEYIPYVVDVVKKPEGSDKQ